jgi:hypothetical protein
MSKSHAHRSSYRQNDQTVCPACGKCWDINDRDEPDCITEVELGVKQENQRKKTLMYRHYPGGKP